MSQRGNVVCSRAKPNPEELQAALVGNYNLTMDILMRTVPEMQHMSGQCPCNVSDPTKVYISFLKPQAEALERLAASPMLEPCTLKGPICL